MVATIDEAQILLQDDPGENLHDNLHGPASAASTGAPLTEARAIIEELSQLAAEERQAAARALDSLPAAVSNHAGGAAAICDTDHAECLAALAAAGLAPDVVAAALEPVVHLDEGGRV